MWKTDEEIESRFQAAENIMSARPDWVNGDNSEDWTYSASFNGVLVGDRRFPRLVDVGLEPLTVELVQPRVFRIHSCGVRDGCPKHVIHTETVSLDDVRVFKERLTTWEHAALSIDLQALAWCLIVGECSQATLTLTLR